MTLKNRWLSPRFYGKCIVERPKPRGGGEDETASKWCGTRSCLFASRQILQVRPVLIASVTTNRKRYAPFMEEHFRNIVERQAKYRNERSGAGQYDSREFRESCGSK